MVLEHEWLVEGKSGELKWMQRVMRDEVVRMYERRRVKAVWRAGRVHLL